MKLYIKYMVSLRCKMFVKSELEKLGLQFYTVEMGVVETQEEISTEKMEQLKAALWASGLELMQDKRALLIERIKNVIIQMVYHSDETPKLKNSEYLSEKLEHDYTYLANLFSEATALTIEQFIILHKIERVKELLIYDELNLTEISYKLNYSSVAHLSSQFKKVTGLTPTYFKQIKDKRKLMLENVRMI